MTIATDMLAKYMAAEQAILEGKDVRIGDRSLAMEDLESVRAGRREREKRVSAEGAAVAGVSSLGGLTFYNARLDR